MITREDVSALTGTELKLFIILKLMAGTNTSVEVTLEELTNWTEENCTRTVIRTINGLVDKGYISKTVQGGPYPSIYHILK